MDRNTIFDHVERLRTKPEHIRRRIAVGTATGITAVVAAGWMLAVVFSGSLAIAPSTVGTGDGTLASAPGTSQIAGGVTQTKSAFDSLLGAVGFANASSAPATITVVNASTSTPSTSDDPEAQPTGGDQTVIPF